ncbi:Uncharacterised protein [Vibrio cholerae]|nr:Uncharacterised protein [Vibrio cholerae]CSI94962.1 Uncharacterised protein [Vibrio cholerae]
MISLSLHRVRPSPSYLANVNPAGLSQARDGQYSRWHRVRYPRY